MKRTEVEPAITRYERAMEISKKTAGWGLIKFVFTVCVADDAYRRPMQYASRQGDYLYGTDGRRLHGMLLQGEFAEWFQDGKLYGMVTGPRGRLVIVERDPELEEKRFPDVAKLLAKYEQPAARFDYTARKGAGAFDGEIQRLLFRFPQPTGLNLGYVKDLLPGADYRVSWYGPNSGVRFVSDTHTWMALIMPMNLDDTFGRELQWPDGWEAPEAAS